MKNPETTTSRGSDFHRRGGSLKASLIATSFACLAAALPTLANAFLVTKYEIKSQIVDFHIPNDGTSRAELREAAQLAVSLHGKQPITQELPQRGALPALPGTMSIKSITPGLPIQVLVPSCPDAAFTVNAIDNGLEQFDRVTQYTACGFPSAQGWRVTIFANAKAPTSGLKSGAFVCPLIEKLGMSCDPMVFVRQSIGKFEEVLLAKGLKHNLITMDPALPGRTVTSDPFVAKPVAEDASTTRPSLASRVAARKELVSLGLDPADRRQMRKAVEDSDEVLVELFVLAGAVDHKAADENGKVMLDYAKKETIRKLLSA